MAAHKPGVSDDFSLPKDLIDVQVDLHKAQHDLRVLYRAQPSWAERSQLPGAFELPAAALRTRRRVQKPVGLGMGPVNEAGRQHIAPARRSHRCLVQNDVYRLAHRPDTSASRRSSLAVLAIRSRVKR